MRHTIQLTAIGQQRREARLFGIGAFLFALGAFPGYANLVGVTADNATYFLGSIFFTGGGVTQWAARQPGAWRRPGEWEDWWAAGIQAIGTFFFNISTGSALITGLSAAQEDRLVWRPDAFGSVCFLVASALACVATSKRDRLWDPDARTWWSAWLNMIGSVAFGVSALGAYVNPDSGQLSNAALADLGTFIGALCFLFGALAMRPAGRPRLRAEARPG
ncbi:MAG TPA: hypothetical protein VMT10_03740 [Solirubrobacteraceae bacterium]|nr:hypothetical protein [Solirubrobacteraceae bacterium]